MSVRQYIGARYVTKIYENSLDPSSAEWEANINYEPLTMVTYNYGSYLSKKQVPANIGNPADNPTYWAQTGFYNGQIAMLQNEIDTVRDSISHHKRIIILSDSWGERTDGNGKTFLQLIGDYTGLSSDDYYYNALGGSAFYQTNPNLTTFLDLLEAIENNVTDKSTITDIVVVGMTNDITRDTNGTAAGIVSFMDYAKLTYPNAKVSLMACGIIFTSDMMSAYDIMLGVWKNGTQAGATFITNSEYLMHNSALLDHSDFAHPNSAGVTELAKQVLNGIYNGSIDVRYRYNPNATAATLTGFNLSISANKGHCTNDNGKLSFVSYGGTAYMISINSTSPLNTYLGAEIDITLTDSTICGFYAGGGATVEVRPITIMDRTTAKEYRALISPFISVNDGIILKIICIDPIPSSDNVTQIGICMSESFEN